ETITQLGLEYRLMTQFTSFVAVEEMTVTDGGEPRRIDVPVEMPEGVSYEGVFGNKDEKRSRDVSQYRSISPTARMKPKSPVSGPGSAGGVGRGQGGGVGPGRGGNAGGGDMAIGGGRALEPEAAKKLQQQLSKLHPSIIAVIDRLKNNRSQAIPGEAKFVRDGKAEIEVWLTNKSPEIISQLKQLGFEVILDPQSSKLIIGRLPVEKLEALAELAIVKYVAPQLK
ncbi:MAG: hypothetical protein L0220_08440, partial [Acidobacteria bacterium]|nr:hypothetical protein [Acidobacteriota bacterium]